MSSKQRRDAQILRGGCVACWRVADASSRMCSRCLPKKRARNLRWKTKKIKAGMCAECGREPRSPWRTLGERCAAKKVAYYANRKAA